jgi:hypothetical protein
MRLQLQQHVPPAALNQALLTGRDGAGDSRVERDVSNKRSRSRNGVNNQHREVFQRYSRYQPDGGDRDYRGSYRSSQDRSDDNYYGQQRNDGGFFTSHYGESTSALNGFGFPKEQEIHRGESDMEVTYGPSFEEASDYVSQCFIDTGNINLNYSSSRGEHFACNDTSLLRSSEVRSEMVVMVSQFAWTGRGQMDVDTAASSNANFLFAEVVGDPRRSTRLKPLGFLKPNVRNDLFKVPEHFAITTPSRFLIPRGSFDVAVAAIRSKTRASVVQVQRQTMESPEGKPDNMKGCMLVTLDNQHIFSQDKTNSVARQNQLKVAWRLGMPRMHLIAPDQTLDLVGYRNFLREAVREDQPVGSVLASAVLLGNVGHLLVLTDKTLFAAIMQCQFEGLEGGLLSLVRFNPQMKGLGRKPTFQGRMMIAQGLLNLELTLRGIFDEDFKGVFSDVREGLEGVETKYKRVADDYIVYTGEKTLTAWGRVIRTLHRSLLFPDISLKEAKGCVRLLKGMLELSLERISGIDAASMDKEYRDMEVEETGLGLAPYVATVGRSTLGPVTLNINTCSHWFAGGLKVKDKKGGGTITCSKPIGSCTRDHISPSAVTKDEAIRWNSKESWKDLKVRIAQGIAGFTRFSV